MSNAAPAPKRPCYRSSLFALAFLVLATGVFFGWIALETYVFAERIHLLTSEKRLKAGMTQEEVENLFELKPEDREDS